MSIRELSRNVSAVVESVERSGRSTVVTRHGRPVVAVVALERAEDALFDLGDPSAPPLAGLPAMTGSGEARHEPGDPALLPAVAERGVSHVAELTSELVIRRAPQPPRGAGARLVYAITGRRVRIQPKRNAARLRERAAQARTEIEGACRRVGVLSTKGGTGKSTVTAYLAHTLAIERRDRVVAVDANPDFGTLAHRVRRETSASVTELLRAADSVHRYSDLRTFTNQASSRAEFVAADDDPGMSGVLGKNAYHRIVSLLDQHFSLLVLDCGTGILDDATQAVLQLSDQVLVVTTPALDASRAAAGLLDWLEAHGYADLVGDALVVLNQVRYDTALSVDAVDAYFARRCRSVVRVPWDPVLATGAEAGLEELRPRTRDAFLELAAAVATGFSMPSHARDHLDETAAAPLAHASMGQRGG